MDVFSHLKGLIYKIAAFNTRETFVIYNPYRGIGFTENTFKTAPLCISKINETAPGCPKRH